MKNLKTHQSVVPNRQAEQQANGNQEKAPEMPVPDVDVLRHLVSFDGGAIFQQGTHHEE